jgi:hypothetical protein
MPRKYNTIPNSILPVRDGVSGSLFLLCYTPTLATLAKL